MADSALGAVSLGIQICGGIRSYIGALRERSASLEALSRQCETLQAGLVSISSTIRKVDPVSSSISGDTARECLSVCQVDLKALEAVLLKLSGCPVSNPRFKDKLREQATKLSYPFRRGQEEQIQVHLGRAIGTLQLGLLALGLEASVSSNKDLSENVLALRSEVGAFNGPLSMIPNLQHSVDGVAPQLDQNTNKLSDQIETMHLQTETSFFDVQTRLDEIASVLELMRSRSIVDRRDREHVDAMAFGRLIANQANLGEPKDDVFQREDEHEPGNATSKHSKGISKNSVSPAYKSPVGCICEIHTTRRRIDTQYFVLGITARTISEQALHDQDCPHYPVSDLITQRSLEIHLRLKSAIDVSFGWTTGAGELSLSPGLTSFLMVDHTKAPAFLLVDRVFRRLKGMKSSEQTTSGQVVSETLIQLNRLYREGTASPTDVNFLHEQSPLEILYDTLVREHDSLEAHLFSASLTKLLKGLAAMGMPMRFSINFIIRLHSTTLKDGRVEFILETLLSSATWQLKTDPVRIQHPGRMHSLLALLRHSEKLAERIECGPLSLAILKGDVEGVRRLASQYHCLFRERNKLGQTPLHLAMLDVDILRIIVSFADVQLLEDVDVMWDSALHYALSMSNAACSKPTPSFDHYETTPCRCIERLSFLLSADVSIVPYRDYYLEGYIYRYGGASPSAKWYLAEQLRSRRRQLLDLAISHLPLNEWKLLGHGGAVLDVDAIRVQMLLERQNIPIPNAIRSFIVGKINVAIPDSSICSDSVHTTVYQALACASDAQIHWDLGFTQTEKPGSLSTGYMSYWGVIPAPRLGFLGFGDHHPHTPSYVEWMLRHDVNLRPWVVTFMPTYLRMRPNVDKVQFVAESAGLFLAQAYGQGLGRDLKGMYQAHTMRSLILEEIENPEPSRSCPCSDAELDPFIIMLFHLCRSRLQTKIPRLWAITHLMDFLGKDCSLKRPKILRAAIRFLTFQEFKDQGLLRHVCRYYNYPHRPRSPEEAEEILEEDAFALSAFEKMVAGFEEVVFSRAGADQDNPDNTYWFWRSCWCERMKRTLMPERKQLPSDEFRRATEAIGVKWHTFPEAF